MIFKLIIIIILSLLISLILCRNNNTSNFKNTSSTKQLTSSKIENKSDTDKSSQYMDEFKKLTKEENENPIGWSKNNVLETMDLKSCGVGNRVRCDAAPAWWYPEDKYSPEEFKVKFYGDNVNPVFDILGDVQNTFWDFRSVRPPFKET